MWEDTLVEEVHAIRAQLLARFGGDLHQYCEYVRTHPTPHVPIATDGMPDVPLKIAAATPSPPVTGNP